VSKESRPNLPSYDPVRDAEVLLEVAIELQRLADEARERARAAFERIGRTLPPRE
jgi:hypothetical protein